MASWVPGRLRQFSTNRKAMNSAPASGQTPMNTVLATERRISLR